MASVETDIANIALGMIGNADGITSMNETSHEARTCRRFYDQAVREALEAYDWPFARTYGLPSVPQDYSLSGYSYAALWPSDALAIRGIARDLVNEPDNEFHIATVQLGDKVERVIHSDKAGGVIVYTRDVKDPSLFTPLFCGAAGSRLACYIALPITQDKGKRDDAEKRFELMLERAAVSVGNQGRSALNPKMDPDWIVGRRG